MSIEGKAVIALLDSGASLSLLREDLCEQMKLSMEPGKEIRIKIGDGTYYTVNRTVSCNVTFEQITQRHTFYVYKHLPYSVILSIQFICQFFIQIKASPSGINVESQGMDLMIQEDVREKIQSIEATTIKSNSSCYIEVRVDRPTGLVFVNDNFLPMLTVFGGVYKVENYKTWIKVENNTPFPVLVHKNQTITTIGDLNVKTEHIVAITEKESEDLNFDISSELPKEEQKKLREVLERNKDVFARNTMDLTQTNVLTHRIQLTDTTPIQRRQFRQANVEKEAIKEQISSLLNAGIIEATSSDWSSPFIMIRKKDGTYRFVNDFRALNARTIKDCYNLPSMEQILEGLAGQKIFSTADLMKGFFQVLLHPDDRTFTSFWCDYGLYCYRALPMGLINSPATFQRVMDSVLRDLKPQSAVAYLDDLLMYGKTFDEHRENLQKVFDALRKANLKLHVGKCQWGVSKVVFLGVMITPDGLQPDPKKLSAISELKPPSCVRQVREVLGLMGFYRRYIPHFSILAAPLHKLTNKDQDFQWTDDCQTSFQELKDRLTMAPVLVHYDPKIPLVVVCDASAIGIGAVLSHRVGDEERPISYTSRLLNKAERNYSATDREMLSLVNALKKFRHFLLGVRFKVVTDHQALTYLMSMKDPHGRIARWLVFLMPFEFDICYRKGKKLVNADALSRMPVDDPDLISIDQEVEDSLLLNEAIDIIQLQEQDPYCIDLIQKLNANNRRILDSGFKKLDGVLIREVSTEDGQIPLIVLPEVMISSILEQCHEDTLSGHSGVARTLYRIQSRFYRRKLPKLVRKFVQSCSFCQSRKPRNNYPDGIPMQLPVTTTPMDILCIDFAGPVNPSLDGNRYILAAIDVCTRYLISEATQKQTTDTVINFLLRRIIHVHGPPSVLISDRGSCFTSEQFQVFLRGWNIEHRMSSAYHPESNGIIEQSNKTMGIMLSKVYQDYTTTWDRHLHECDFAFNTSVNRATKRTPYEMLHLKIAPAKCDGFVKILRSKILASSIAEAQEIRSQATQKLRAVQQQTKDYRTDHLISRQYSPGDKVLVYKPQRDLETCKKFRIKWHGPFEVLRKVHGLEATYEVRVIGKTGRDNTQRVNILNMRRFFGRDHPSAPNTLPKQVTISVLPSSEFVHPDQMDDSDEEVERGVSNEEVTENRINDRNDLESGLSPTGAGWNNDTGG